MFRDLPPYGETRFSDFWTSKVPSSWSEMPGLAVLEENRRTNKGLVEDQVLSLSYGKVIVKPVEKQRGLVPESYEGYQILDPGDIVVRPTDLQNDQTSIRVGHVRDRGIITSAYIGLRPRGEWRDAYAYLYLSVIDSSKRIYGMGSGLRQQLGWDDLKRMPCLVPPVEEQAAIVKYLAHANARIDNAIAAKRRLIALLEEQQCVADDEDFGAVSSTFGHLIRLKYVLAEVDDRSSDGKEEHLSMSQRLGLVPANYVERTLTAESMSGGRICEEGDIVLNRLKAHLGVFAIAPMRGVVSPDYTILRVRGDVDPSYLCALLKTHSLRPELRKRTKGIVEGFWRLYTDDLLTMRLAIPERKEQEAVLRRQQERAEDVLRTKAKIDQEINLIQEFRTRLVADVVTGQVDVRAIAETLPDAPADSMNRDVDTPAVDGGFDVDVSRGVA